ncbi:hypothetical protein [Nocardia asteroides]|uniref:hypothetical protein n=1 Tax=Nocardia asteroides TaxID=1824 RepID=UPI00364F7FA8
MDYDLARMGPREFEHLSQALAKKVLGPGVSVFGDGRDGGREATFDGPVGYPFDGARWQGYGIVQAKHRQRPHDSTADADWLKRQIAAELDGWLDATAARGRLPDYLLFTTNVVLSPVPGTGGIAKVEEYLAERFRKRPEWKIKGWAVWHADEVCRFLDMYGSIRRAYAHLVTPGDVLSHAIRVVDGVEGEVVDFVRTHVCREFLADQYVRLGQAGAQGERQRIRLGLVAVDLMAHLDDDGETSSPPSQSGSDGVPIVAHILAKGDRVLRASHADGATGPRNIVVVGGPGQGKSTVGQLVCQVYRAAMLSGGDESMLTAEIREALGLCRKELAAGGIEIPSGRRWPIRVELNDYANAITAGDGVSILNYLARKMNKRSTGSITGSRLASWLRSWPAVVVLDGLDEVAAQTTREDVLLGISEFLAEMQQRDADILVVATSRPQGYSGEFHAGDYEQTTLRPMSESAALRYARRLAAARHADDPDMHEIVLERLQRAVADESTTRLMRSPLQVTIMSLLVERRARLPHNRFELFEAYYDTIYLREVDKPTSVGRLLEENRLHVDWMHQHVGLALQRQALLRDQLDAVLSESELRRLAGERMLREVEDVVVAENLAHRIVDAATDRLVLLVAPEAGYVGFEVRSLQEFMAAKALLAGPESEIMPRLEALATLPSWRNTWLLAVTGIFAVKPHLRDDVLVSLRLLDSANSGAMALTPGAELAVELLDEGVTRLHPRYQHLLIDHAVQLIAQPPRFRTHLECARVLADVVTGDRAVARVERAVRDAMTARDARIATAMLMIRRWRSGGTALRSLAEQLHAGVAELGRAERAALKAADCMGANEATIENFTSAGQRTLAESLLPSITPEDREAGVYAGIVDATERVNVEIVYPRDIRLRGIRLSMVELDQLARDRGEFSVQADDRAVELCVRAASAQPLTDIGVTIALIQIAETMYAALSSGNPDRAWKPLEQ